MFYDTCGHGVLTVGPMGPDAKIRAPLTDAVGVRPSLGSHNILNI